MSEKIHQKFDSAKTDVEKFDPVKLDSREFDPQEFERAKNFILEHQNFILASHARTDGDDLGSMLAIFSLLKSWGKNAVPLAVGGVPATLKFLPHQNEVRETIPENFLFDAIILFGCYDPIRAEIPEITNANLPILNFDHHHDNKRYGTVNVVDEKKSSVAELTYDFIRYTGAPINADTAKCLLTGIFTDTGSFMHSNTSTSSLAVAAELMRRGARIDTINSFTFNSKNISTLRAWGRALENTNIDRKEHCAISVFTEEDMREVGDINEDTFLGFADTLSGIPEADFSLFIRQEGEYIKGSLRSNENKNVNVFKIARLFGGGGHRLASAFRVKGKITKISAGAWRVNPPQN